MAVNSNELKASVRLDGATQFRKDISDVNSNLKQLDAESKKVTAEFQGQANSVEALRAKQENLNKTLEQAERKVQLYDSRIKSLEQQQKRIADSTEEYRDQLKNAQEALSRMDKGTDTYAKQEKAVEALARKVQLGEQNQQKATNEIAKYRVEQTKAETAVAKLNHEIDDNSRYLDEAERSADKCADSIDEYGRRTKQATEESQGLGDVAKIALGNIAAQAATRLADAAMDAVRALGEAGRAAAAYADEILTASMVTGLSTDTLQEYAYAAELIDTDLADVEKALGKNTKSMASAQAGSKAYAEAYDKLGVSVTDASGHLRSSEDVFWDCIDALGKVENETEADAIAMQIFGKSARDLNPLIEAGSAGFRQFADEAHEVGAVLDRDTLEKLGDADDAFQRLEQQTGAFKNAIGASTAPLLGTLAEGATGFLKAITNALTPPPNNDLQNFLQDISDDIEQTKTDLEGIGSFDLRVETNTAEIEMYRSVLEKATRGEELSEFEKYQLKAAVDKLGGSIPELAAAYDEETSSINLTTDALDALLESTEKQIRQQAYTEVLESAYKAQAEAALEAAKAQSAYESATEDLQKKLGELSIEDFMAMSPADQAAYFGNVNETVDAVNALVKTHKDAAKAVEEAGKAESDAAKIVEDTEEAYKNLTKTEQKNANEKKRLNKVSEESEKRDKSAAGTKDDLITTTEEEDRAIKRLGQTTADTAKETENHAEGLALLSDALGWVKGAAEENADGVKGFLQDVGDSMMEDIEEKVKAAAASEQAALETTRQAYEDNYNSIKSTLSQRLSLWDVFNGGEDVTVEQMIENLKSQTEGITQYKEEMAAVIAEYGDELGPDLINTLQSMGTDAANTWHHMFVTMSQDNAPELFAEMGQQWAEGLDLSDQIAKYCAGNLTAYQVATNQLGSTKIEWTGLRESVQNMTPELDAAITAAQEAGVQIPDGLAEGLASGETTANDAVQLLTKSMQGTFQGLYEIAEQSGVQIPEGLSKGMEGSAEEYQAAIGQLTDALSAAGNEAGTAAAEEISTGLTDNTDSVEGAAEDTAGAAADAAEGKKSEFQSAGSSAGSQYASGMTSQKAVATSAGRQLAQAAKTGADARKDAFNDVGVNMARALAAGIRAGQSSAINAAVSMAVEAYKAAKNAIGQHSPTGIFRDELGKNIPLAVAYGITENTQPAERAAAVMARSTYDAAKYAAMTEAMASQTVAAPAPVVNVDTAPIARMIGSSQPGTQIVNYFTISGATDPKAFADDFAAELTQKLRS